MRIWFNNYIVYLNIYNYAVRFSVEVWYNGMN